MTKRQGLQKVPKKEDDAANDAGKRRAKAKGQGQADCGRRHGCMTDEACVEVEEPAANVHVPGSSASTIKVPGLLNSLPRLLLRSDCRLRGFLRSIIQSPADRTDRATPAPRGASTWPMPLPYPEMFVKRGHIRKEHELQLLNMQVLVLNWLYLGRPGGAPAEIRLGKRLNSKQWSAVQVLRFWTGMEIQCVRWMPR